MVGALGQQPEGRRADKQEHPFEHDAERRVERGGGAVDALQSTVRRARGLFDAPHRALARFADLAQLPLHRFVVANGQSEAQVFCDHGNPIGLTTAQ